MATPTVWMTGEARLPGTYEFEDRRCTVVITGRLEAKKLVFRVHNLVILGELVAETIDISAPSGGVYRLGDTHTEVLYIRKGQVFHPFIDNVAERIRGLGIDLVKVDGRYTATPPPNSGRMLAVRYQNPGPLNERCVGSFSSIEMATLMSNQVPTDQ